MVSVPHLQFQPRWDLALTLIPREDGLLPCRDDAFLRLQVLERVYKAPVEIPFAGERAVVDVCALAIIGAFHPAEQKQYVQCEV